MDKSEGEADDLTITCELCGQSVPANRSLAGTFERICNKCFGYQVQDMFDEMHEIEGGIYLGNEEAHKNEQMLKQHNIGAILTCA